MMITDDQFILYIQVSFRRMRTQLEQMNQNIRRKRATTSDMCPWKTSLKP